MRSVPGMLHRQLLVAVVLALVCALVSGAPAFAATGSVTSTATPSDAAPGVGQQIVVAISINVSGVDAPDNKLGSFTGALEWNPAVLAYNSHTGIGAGFTGVVNPANAATGRIVFNGANASGATGNVTVLSITFDVVGEGTSALDLSYTAMAAATTFANLLPLLTVTDSQVVVGSVPDHTLYVPFITRN